VLSYINPVEYKNWDQLLLDANMNYSFFHTSIWAKTLIDAYGYTPFYFAKIQDGQLKFLFPAMEVKSPLTGNRLVSLPFTDYCPPFADPNVFMEFLEELATSFPGISWKYISIRVFNEITPSTIAFRHWINLDRELDSILASSSSSNRRNIKKARKGNFQVVKSSSRQSLQEFCYLNCLTRKRHGLPPQPDSFFDAVYNNIISKGNGVIFKAVREGQTIAASIYFHFHQKAMYKYGASDFRFQNLRANNLIMWRALKWYHENGFKELCLGKTDYRNEGLRRFKMGWGSEEQTIYNTQYHVKERKFFAKDSKTKGFHNQLFRILPVPLLRLSGNLLYRHMG
jgi:hypothetical protein